MKGESLVKTVQRNLWSKGYRVKVASEFYDAPKFDLLIEGKYRVKVVDARTDAAVSGDYDVVAIVSHGTGAFKGRVAISFERNGQFLANAREAFELPASKRKMYGKEKGKVGSSKAGGRKTT